MVFHMSLAVLFMLGQSLATLPALIPGTTVMVVSDDLRTVYARGVVQDDTLIFDTALPPGQGLQLLIYPPAETESGRAALPAAEAAGLQSLRVTVDASGQDLLVPGTGEPISLRAWLQTNHGIGLNLPAY